MIVWHLGMTLYANYCNPALHPAALETCGIKDILSTDSYIIIIPVVCIYQRLTKTMH